MLIEIDNIKKSYGKHVALNDVSLQVAEGGIFGLLGPNGAGKTTLIRIINRILIPDEGEVRIDGHPLTAEDVEQIGYLPEERGLYKKMKVGEQAVYLACLKGLDKATATRRLHSWFERMGIDGWWNKRVEELSKGMQQKVQFITTVLHEPRLLIFDEPFSGFDPVNATMLKEEILALRDRGATILLSTHNMASVEELCDRIALIDHSRVVLSGSVRDIRTSYRRGRFRICTEGADATLNLPEGFHTEVEHADYGETTFTVDVPTGCTANELLQLAVAQTSIISFNEVLPTMNDIFIETINQLS